MVKNNKVDRVEPLNKRKSSINLNNNLKSYSNILQPQYRLYQLIFQLRIPIDQNYFVPYP